MDIGSGSPSENTASALEEAAEHSTPEAANVLDNAAEQVREQNISDPAAAQQALEAAGSAPAWKRPIGSAQTAPERACRATERLRDSPRSCYPGYRRA